jgi:hypothetical protein
MTDSWLFLIVRFVTLYHSPCTLIERYNINVRLQSLRKQTDVETINQFRSHPLKNRCLIIACDILFQTRYDKLSGTK